MSCNFQSRRQILTLRGVYGRKMAWGFRSLTYNWTIKSISSSQKMILGEWRSSGSIFDCKEGCFSDHTVIIWSKINVSWEFYLDINDFHILCFSYLYTFVQWDLIEAFMSTNSLHCTVLEIGVGPQIANMETIWSSQSSFGRLCGQWPLKFICSSQILMALHAIDIS